MKAWKYCLWIGGPTLLIVGIFLFVSRNIAYTDDAYVQGNQVILTPLKEGFIQGIFSDDTYLVKAGQPLITLDETDAKIALDRAKEELSLTVREVSQAFYTVFALHTDIQGKKAEFIQAAQDYEHRLQVFEAGAVSVEDFEHAVASLKNSFYLLATTEFLFQQALAFIENTSIENHPKTRAAIDLARQAWVDLHRCTIYAPVEGLVAQRTAQVGMWVSPGTPLLSIIPLDQIWINANFKETQMRRMRIGQQVSLHADLYGDSVLYRGIITGLPGGAGNAFSILPPQNLSGNWIKIVQRLPVRVEINKEQLIDHPLRIGLSMTVTVDLQKNGPLIPISNAGAPSYTTPIYIEEEQGDLAWITEIVQSNCDPKLHNHLKQPLLWKQ